MRSNALVKALNPAGAEHPGFGGGGGPSLKGVRGCATVIRISCGMYRGQVHQVLCAEPKGHKGRHRETEISCRSIKHAAHR